MIKAIKKEDIDNLTTEQKITRFCFLLEMTDKDMDDYLKKTGGR